MPHVARIPVPTPFHVGDVNCYLIEAGRLTLLDAGPRTPEAWAALEAGVRAAGRRLEDVELLVLTHQHYDHFGQAAAVVERSGAEVAALAPLADFVGDHAAAYDAADAFAMTLMAAFGVDEETVARLAERSRRNRRLGGSVEVALRLADGDAVDLGGVRLRALHRPGHSPTDTVFVDEASGLAFVGDHLIAHMAATPLLDATPGADPYDPPGRVAQYLESLRATERLELAEALSGHGEPIADHRALVARRLRGHERRKEQLAAALAPGPQSLPSLIAATWPRLTWEQTFVAVSDVLGHLDLLVREGRAARERVDGGFRFRPA